MVNNELHTIKREEERERKRGKERRREGEKKKTGKPKQCKAVQRVAKTQVHLGEWFNSKQLHITQINVVFIHLLWSVDDFFAF